MDDRKYLAALIATRNTRAIEALSTAPPPDAAFFLGREVGVQLGLRMAEKLLTDSLKEEKEAP